MRRIWWLLCVVVMAGMFYAAPVEAALIGTKDEISMGRDVAQRLEKQYGLVEDPALQERVTRIGMRMVAVSDRKDLPYTFKVLKSKDVNALACPGGFIYVFQGLVDLMPSDDELAGVIGHEIGHVVKRHTVRQIEKSLGLSILFGVVFGDRGVLLQNLAFNALMSGYSRADEREADQLGFRHSFLGGYNPYSMKIGMEKLGEKEGNYHADLFATHPEAKDRVSAVQGMIDAAGVKPHTVRTAQGVMVAEGAWQLPVISLAFQGYKPVYRAEFAAGNIYRAAQQAGYDPDRFIPDYDGENIRIFYEDRLIHSISPQDAAAAGMDLQDFAAVWLEGLRQWKKI